MLSHFAPVRKEGKCVSNNEHLNYYRESIERYSKFLASNNDKFGRPLKESRFPCQIEKDERFWIADCLMTVYYSKERKADLTKLFEYAFGQKPPVPVSSWNDCFEGDLHLFFETNLPSPKIYKNWLRKNYDRRGLIPYINNSVGSKENLEGPTNVDALLINSTNGFAVLIEAKVLSDISQGVTYDCMRNQIARNVDVMLENNSSLCPPLNKRDPEKTIFLLITPQLFKENPSSRLYGYKYAEYKRSPEALAKDLPHRSCPNWQELTNRIGWATWEDFRRINSDCCSWLQDLDFGRSQGEKH